MTRALVAVVAVVAVAAPLGAYATEKPAWRKPSRASTATGVPASPTDASRADALPPGYTRGTPWTGKKGITETVAQIMARARTAKARTTPIDLETFDTEDRSVRTPNPLSPNVSQYPPRVGTRAVEGGGGDGPYTPQTNSTSFDGANFDEIQAWPPDSSGAVGPTQYFAGANNRFRTFNKTTGVADGAINANSNTFFNSVRQVGAQTTDPRIRFDSITRRWFVSMITINNPNQIMLAVSSGPTITAQSSFTFFEFQQDVVSPVGDPGCLADYATLGVDANALYLGANMFCPQLYVQSTVFVVRKSSVLGAGPIVVTAFRGVAQNGFAGGPMTPQGVDNRDPSATEGYFVGITRATTGSLTVRRVSNPGGTPALGPNIEVTVPTTAAPINVPHKNPSGANNNPLDAIDDRLMMASMRNGHLWTVHNIQVNASGVASASGGRDGSRWYDLTITPSTVSLTQSGTLFDSAASSPKSYWMPSIAVSGQGHMVIGSSVAGANDFVDATSAGRLASDALGTIRAPTNYTSSSFRYNPQNLGQSVNRWGDYSYTSVDPDDDMTMWTVQEYVNATDKYATRVVKLLAPPPATPSSATPSTVAAGQSSVNVVVTGTSASGSGFFDPGAGFAQRIAASVGGGVTVNSVTFTDPTHVTLNISTVGASAGAKNVTVINPDSQSSTGTGILTVSTASGPAGSISPTSWSFGSRTTGTTSPAQTFTLTSNGTSALTVGAVSLTGANASDFVVSSNGCTGQVLAVNASCTVGVTFTPGASGARSATLSVASDGTNAPHTSALGGIGVTPDSVPPSQVTGLTGVPGDSSAALSWNAATANVGVDHYVVYRNGVDVAHPTGTSITINGLVNGTSYVFSVSAVDAAGNEGPVSASVAVTPQVPIDVWPGWSQFHGNQARTGSVAGTSTLTVPAVRQSISVGLDPVASPLVADLDGDGGSDVVAVTKQSTSAGRTKVVAYQQILGALQPLWEYTFTSEAGAPTSSYANIAVGDLDADGSADVAAYYGSLSDVQGNGEWNIDGQVVVLDGLDGHVIASIGSSDVFEGVDFPIAVGDVDGDGKSEIVLQRYVLGPPSLATAEAAGVHLTGYSVSGSTLSRKFDSVLSTNQTATGPAIAELRSSHAGKEIVVGEDQSNTVGKVYICQPAGASANCNESIATPTGVRGLAVGDLDGDGSKEIVANGRTGQSLSVIKTALPTLSLVSRADGRLWNTPSIADVDGDGKAEIVNVQYSNFVDDTASPGDVMVRGFNGTAIADEGTLARPGPLRTPTESLSGGALVDMNGNGSPEFVFGSADNTVTAVRVGSGTPSVLWAQAIGAVTHPTPAVGDVTGEGAHDVVVGTSDGRLLVISQNRAPTATGGAHTIDEDTSASFTLPGSDPDQGDVPVFTIQSLPEHGTVLDCSAPPCEPVATVPYTFSGSPDVRYEPDQRYAGPDSFTYGVSDGKATTIASESFTMTYVNAAPAVPDRQVNAATAQPTHVTLTFADDGGPACLVGPCPPPDTYFGITAIPVSGALYDGGSTADHRITADELPYRLSSALVTYASNASYSGADTFRYKYNDGELESSPTQGGVSIAVGATGNQDPVANDGSASTAEDTPVTVTLTASDPDGASLTYTVASLPAHGTLKDGSTAITTVPATLSGDTVTYIPAADYNGSDSFTFRANDGVTDSNTATESLTVTPVNDAPAATAQSVSTPRDTAKTVTLLGSDVDGNALTFKIQSLPAHGTLYNGSSTAAAQISAAPSALSSAKVTYAPDAGYTGSDSFAFVARDAQADSAPATVSIAVLTPSTTRVRPSSMGLWQNDSSTDNPGGSAQGTFVYGPATPPLGPGSFQQHANTSDKHYLQTFEFNGARLEGIHLAFSTYTSTNLTAAVNISVDRTGDGRSDETLVFEPYEQARLGSGPAVTAGTWQSWDASAGMWWSTATGPGGPYFTLAQYLARPGNAGVTLATLSQAAYRVVVGSTGQSWPNFTGQVDMVVVNGAVYNFDPDNSAPVAAAQSVSAKDATPKLVTLSATDADNDALIFKIASLPAHGSLKDGATTISAVPFTLSGNTVTYTATAGYSGSDSFTFKANDGTVDSSAATVSITVQLSNHAPVATVQSFTADEDVAKTLTLAGTDVDGDPLTFRVAGLPANGSLYNGSGTSGHKILASELPYALSGTQVTYLGKPDFNGSDSFTFKANDGVLDSAAAAVSGSINPVNDAPVASDQATGTGQDAAKTITLTGTDVDGNTLSFTVASLPAHGSLYDGTTTGSPAITSVPYTLASNKVTYQPAGGYLGSDSFTFRANDGQADSANVGTVTIGIADNVAPDTTITGGPTGTVASGSATFAFSASEPGTFQCKLDAGAYAGCVSPQTYTGLGEGGHTFSVRALDGSGNVDPTPATRAWTVDTVAPETVIVSGPSGTVRATSFTFTFTATESGVTFACSLDGASFTACVSPRNVTVGEGTHVFSVRSTDAAANVDATPATRTWTVDLTPPAVPSIASPVDGDTIATSFVTVSGIADPGDSVRVYEGAAARAATSANSSGTWTARVPLGNGSHTLEATAADVAGNESARSTPVTFQVSDTVPPSTPTISSPASGAVVPGGTVTIAGSAEPGSTVSVSEGTTVLGTTTVNGGSWALTVLLPDGNHSVTARASDPAGNISGSASVSFRIGPPDSRAPTVRVDDSNPLATTTIGGTANDESSGVDTITVTFTDRSGVPVARTATCSGCRPGGLSASFTVSVAGLAPGTYTVQAIARDVAGNIGMSTRATFLVIPK